MSNATQAYGLTIAQGATVIAGVTSISGPSTQRDPIDITTLSSPSGAKVFLAGLNDAGEVTLGVNYMPQDASQKGLLTSLNSMPQPPSTFTITLTDSGASLIAFSGLVTGFKLDGSVADKLGGEFTLKGTGPVTFPS